jgi:hypothetical protein
MSLARQAILFAAAFSASVLAEAATAHHALEAIYDTRREVEAIATLVRVEWINPHAWMSFHIQYHPGMYVENVPIETLGIGSLRQQGIDREALEIGAQYAITFYPTRSGHPGGFMIKMVRPDGGLIAAPSVDPSGDGCGVCD